MKRSNQDKRAGPNRFGQKGLDMELLRQTVGAMREVTPENYQPIMTFQLYVARQEKRMRY